MAQKKNTRLTSPTMKAAFPYLNRVDDKFNSDGEWKVDLLGNKEDPQVQEFLGKIDEEIDTKFNAVYNEVGAKKKKKLYKQYPYEDVLDDETEEPTGEVRIKTKQAAIIRTKEGEDDIYVYPQLFDKRGNKLDRSKDIIRMNSLIRANVEVNPFSIDSSGMTGVSLRLKAVQVREFADGAGAEAFGFDVEDDDEFDSGDEGGEPESGDQGEDDDGGDF